MLEVLVDLLERGQQPLARLAVEALDAEPQLLDRLDQVVALGGERSVLGLDLAQFLFGTQIDRAQPLAFAAQTFESFLDLGEIRQRIGRLDFGKFGHRRRLDLQHVVDLAADIRETALGALETLLGARQVLARGARRFQCGAGVTVGFGQCVFGFLQAIGAGAPCGFRGLNFGDQRAAFFGENLRGVFQLGAVAPGFGDALLERGDLIARAVLAFDPAGLVGGKRRQPAVGMFGFAHDGLLLGLHFGELGALARNIVAHLREFAFDDRRPEQVRQARFRPLSWRSLLRRGSCSVARALRPVPKAAPPGD